MKRGFQVFSRFRRRPAAPGFQAQEAGPTEPEARSRRPFLLCVTSGKGGTGKSFLTSNLVIRFAQAGLKTLLVDADLGMANLHLLLNITPQKTLYQAVAMGTPIWDVAQRGPGGIWFLPGGSGIAELANLRQSELRFLISRLRQLRRGLDLIVIDTAAGIAHQTTAFLFAADMNLIVTTPDITALTDAYAVIKMIHQNHPKAATVLIPYRVRDRVEGDEIRDRVAGITKRFLGMELLHAGSVSEDPCVRDALRRKEPVTLSFPESPPAQEINQMADRLAREIRRRRMAERDDQEESPFEEIPRAAQGQRGYNGPGRWNAFPKQSGGGFRRD